MKANDRVRPELRACTIRRAPRPLLALLLPLLLALGACSTDDSGSPPPPEIIGSARIRVVGDDPQSQTQLGAALLYEVEPYSKYLPGNTIAAPPGFPVEFSLDLAAPPEEGRHSTTADSDGEEYVSISEAVIAAVDLALLPDKSDTSVTDLAPALLGTVDQPNREVNLVWAERAFSQNGRSFAAGWNVIIDTGTGDCPTASATQACIDAALAAGSTPAEAEYQCIHFEVQSETRPLDGSLFEIQLRADGAYIPPWGNFPFCNEATCDGYDGDCGQCYIDPTPCEGDDEGDDS
jgi:hypothetical protein